MNVWLLLPKHKICPKSEDYKLNLMLIRAKYVFPFATYCMKMSSDRQTNMKYI